MTAQAKSKARQKFLAVMPPHQTPNYSEDERISWIQNLCSRFVGRELGCHLPWRLSGGRSMTVITRILRPSLSQLS